MPTVESQLRLGRVTEMDSLGVGYLRDVKHPMREYLFAERQVVKLPEGPGEIAAEALVWYQLSSVGQVDFVVPASGLVGLAGAVLEHAESVSSSSEADAAVAVPVAVRAAAQRESARG